MNKKKILGILLAVSMLGSMLPTAALAVEETQAIPQESNEVVALTSEETQAIPQESNEVVALASEVTELERLKAAIAQATGAATIQLSGPVEIWDVADRITVDGDKSITLDLNGQTVSATVSHAIRVQDGGRLTITDTAGGGAISGRYTDAGNQLIQVRGGELIVSGGAIRISASDNGANAVLLSGEGASSVLSMTGGAIVATGGPAAVRVEDRGRFTMSGGTIRAENGSTAIRISAGNKTPLSETSITGGQVIADGAQSSCVYVSEKNCGEVSISGGDFRGQVAVASRQKVISGGTFSHDVSAYCVEGFAPVKNSDGTYGISVAAPEPTPTPTPEPEPSVEPGPTPTPTPEPEPSVDPEPAPSVDPEPTPSVDPEPTPSVDPEPTPSVDPEPTPSVKPTPTPSVTPGTGSGGNSGSGGGSANPGTSTPTPPPTVSQEPVEKEPDEEEDLGEQDTPLAVRPWLFTDVAETSWSYSAVRDLFDRGLISGLNDTTFGPKGAITRGQLVALLYRIEGQPEVDGESHFADVSDSAYYAKAILWATQNNLVLGYSEGLFGPKEGIRRQDVAVILYRYAQMKGFPVAGGDLNAFVDANLVQRYAVDAMAWATEAGLISGVGGNSLNPRGGATRAEACAILSRFIALLEQ